MDASAPSTFGEQHLQHYDSLQLVRAAGYEAHPYQFRICVMPCSLEFLPSAVSEDISPTGVCAGVISQICC